MRYTLAILVMLPLYGAAQQKNAFILSSTLFQSNARYHHGKYSAGASTLREFDVAYLRQLDKYRVWFAGAGAGFRKVAFNRFNGQRLMDEHYLHQSVSARAVLRYERFLGRRMKYFFEGGPGYNFQGWLRATDELDEEVQAGRALNGFFIAGKFGFQYSFNDNLALGAALSTSHDLEPSFSLFDRSWKFYSTVFSSGLRFNF